MKLLRIGWMSALSLAARAQPVLPAEQVQFADTVAAKIIGPAHNFYLLDKVPPCSFQRYNYDDWYRFGLIYPIPVYILNALSKQAWLDQEPRRWQAGQLPQARVVDEKTAAAILKNAVCAMPRKRASPRKPPGSVYFISRPEFTDDGQYAVIDIGFRCDSRQGGMGTTYLFRKNKGSWQLAGKKTAWVN